MQPAHRALLRQYESITELESRLAAATERIATLTKERDSAKAEAVALRVDAERYRALKPLLDSADFAYGDPPRSVIVFAWDRPVSADLDAMLDAAIDAARGADHD